MNDIEFRPMTLAERPKLQRLMQYAFADPPPREGEEPPAPLQPEWSLCAFDGERMVASSGAYPFKIRFNGATLPCAGVTAVGTDPGYRRQGLVRELMTRTLIEQHDEGVPAAILWASMGAIYQRFGYGLASDHVIYQFDPRLVRFREEHADEGRVRLLEKAEAMPHLVNLYRHYCMERNLLIHRPPVMWDSMIPDQGGRPMHVAILFDEAGQPRGYVIYQTRTTGSPTGTGPWQELTIVDLVWLDIAAYRGIWHYLLSHDLVTRITWVAVPDDDPAPGLLMEPRLLGKRIQDGIWMRVIDAESVLASRRYLLPGEVSLRVVRDEICPWNVGSYRVAGDGEHVTVERMKGTGSVDLELDPNALSSLVCGHTSASALVRMGRAQATTERLPMLDALFATAHRPTCPNEF